MAKQFILYNLKDDVSQDDFEKWVNEFKGPFISGLPAVKRYTLTKVSGAVQAKLYRYLYQIEPGSNHDHAATGVIRLQLVPGYARSLAVILLTQQTFAFSRRLSRLLNHIENLQQRDWFDAPVRKWR